jgi:hypothetical protein
MSSGKDGNETAKPPNGNNFIGKKHQEYIKSKLSYANLQSFGGTADDSAFFPERKNLLTRIKKSHNKTP